TRPDNDTTVTYTISPKSGAAARSATLTFNINGYTALEKQAFNVEEGVFAGIEGANVSNSFLLPLTDEKFGIVYDYTFPTGLSKGAYTGNGKYILAVYNGTTEKAKAEIGVVARYEEITGFQFVENYKLKVNLVPTNAAKADAEAFLDGTNTTDKVDLDGTLYNGSNLLDILHMPYGGNGTEDVEIALPTAITGTTTTITWVADENFVEDSTAPGTFKLVTQYFRYHEAKLTATFKNGTATTKVVFYINIGLAEKPLTYYQGGRSNSYQGSTNPAKRGDMLQNFSFFDKYVGTVANANERGNQYWSEFSGYTLWVDETVNFVNVVMTRDTKGLVAVPKAAAKTIRYQLFIMEFEVNRIYKYDAIEGQNVPRVDVRYARATYGGNFGHFIVNETNVDLDIPVSALSMGGYFADGETAMKTYSLTSLSIADEGDVYDDNDKATTVLDDYGASFKVSREQTLAYDGYRPGFSLKSNGTAALAEGAQGQYDLYMGSTVKQHLNNDGTYKAAATAAQEVAGSTQYIQYCIAPALSSVYKTPYVIIGAGAYAFQWHSQGYYSLSADFTRAMTGGVRGALIDPDGTADSGDEFYAPAKITVARYTRHVSNEELSDYFVRAVRALSTDYSDVSQSQIDAYKKVQQMYLGSAVDADGDPYNDAAWLPSWLNKTAQLKFTLPLEEGQTEATVEYMSPKEAKAKLDKIATDTEAAALKQKQYAQSVHDKIDALALMHANGGYKNATKFNATEVVTAANGTSYAATVEVPAGTIITATTYANLTTDKANFTADTTDAARIAVLKSREATTLIADADTLYGALTAGRLSFIDADTYDKLNAAKVELRIDELNKAATIAKAADIAAVKAAYDALETAAYDHRGLVTVFGTEKIDGLVLAIQLLSLPADGSVVIGSKDAIVAARKAYNDASTNVKAYVTHASSTLAATIATKEGKLMAAYKAQTVSLVANIRAAAVALLDNDAVDFDALTSEQLAMLTAALADVDTLVEAFKTLYDSSVLRASAAGALTNAAGFTATEAFKDVNGVAYAIGDAVPADVEISPAVYNTLATDDANFAFVFTAKDSIMYYYDSTNPLAPTKVPFASVNALDAAGSLATTIAFIETEKIKKAYTDSKPVIDTTFGMMSDRDDRGRIADLYDAMDAHNGARADEVEDLIDALPAERALVVDDEAKIVAARVAYDALTATQQGLVTASRLQDLADLELAIVDVKLEAIALPVDELIYALPSRIALIDTEAVAAARAAYNALTPKQKAKVNGLSELQDAEADIATLQTEAAAESTAVAAVIKTLTDKLFDETNDKCKVVSADVATFKGYIAAFDALLPYEQAYILGLSGKTVGSVTYKDFATRLSLFRAAVAKVEFFTPAA
ncbi:hypothetical protein, partial [Methanoculleus sp.]|uniref:hypothetical protein n=1 Tax=Methanoculleus sp. TaxID=90427 RepID=UPI0025E147AA